MISVGVRRILFFSIFLCFGLSKNVVAQGSIGDAMFDNFEYSNAIKFYNSEPNLSLNQKENLAYSYYMIQDFENASRLFQDIINEEEDVDFMHFLAISLKNIGKYPEARTYFAKVLQLDSSYLESKVGLASLDKLPELVAAKQTLEVINVNAINTGASTYSPRWYKEGIIFCEEMPFDSLKRRPKIDITDDYQNTDELSYGTAERPLTSIYYADVIGTEVKNLQPFLKSEKYHIGSFAFVPNSDELYFTKIDVINKWDPDTRSHPRIFKMKMEDNPKTESEKVVVKKLSNEVGAGHPEFSNDGNTLYFSSDRPGGFGGSDLYKSTKDEKGNWSAPVNLGANINTDGDELFPYIHNEFFYFSTNGRPGFGGLDIFKIKLSDLETAKPQLLPLPINSISDDYGILISPTDEEFGFVTSNRFGGLGDDDIYLFQKKLEGIWVQGIVKDLNGNPVSNALVKIYDENGNEIAQVYTDENGKYSIELAEEGNYKIVATIPGYADQLEILIDENWDNSKLIEMTLEPTQTAQGQVKNEDGSIASNVSIELKDENGNVIFKGMTDENGYYQFTLEENKTYTITAKDRNLSGSETIKTDEGYDSLKDKDIILRESGTYAEGILLNEDGSIAEGIEVKLLDNNGNLIAVTTTENDGSFHFDLENNKDYQIVAVKEGFEALHNIYTGENYDPEQKFNLNFERVGSESFALVTDKSSNEGINNVKVTLVDETTGNKITTYTDNEGKFTINLKPNRAYIINLDKDGYYPKSINIEPGKKLPKKVDLNQMGDFAMNQSGYNVEKIYFELDSYKISSESEVQMQKIVEALKANPKATITIKSYADCRGPAKYNVSLSWKRSKAVKDYLINKGIKSGRILTESLGATNFVNNCTSDEACTENEHALNRRSEFEIDFGK